MENLNDLLIGALGALGSLLVAILVYLAKGVLDEMKDLNKQLVEIVKNQTVMGVNQEWQYEAIKTLQKEVKDIKQPKRTDLREDEL